MNHDLPGTHVSAICSVDAERKLDTLILRLHGEFDLSADERFRKELENLLERAPATLIVDLRGLTFLDSTGLRALVGLHNHSSAANLDFSVLYDGGTVGRVLQETGLDRVLPTVHTDNAIRPPATRG